MQSHILSIPILGLAVLVAGCASSAPRPTVELTRASTLIDVAQQNGAQHYAAADLQAARDHLQQANEDASRGDNQRAQWLATESGLDAQLASARAQRAKQQDAADQLQQSLKTLRREANQNGAPPPPPEAAPPPAAAPPPPAAPPPSRSTLPPPPADSATPSPGPTD